MWKCMGLMLLLGQFIVVTSQTSEEEVQRHTRKAGDCCPCPGQDRDSDPSASERLPVSVDCPCKARGADLEPASSIFSPVLSAVKPFTRQFDQNANPKPLLEPEVGLASSVLETLREVTEEEYQDAVARDAARSAIQSVLPNEASSDLVTVVVSPNARESRDDALPEASNHQESSCVLPEYGSYADGVLQRSYDMTDAPSNLQRNIQIPDKLRTNTPLRNLFRNPVSWTSDIPDGNRLFFIPTLRDNNLFKRLLLPTIDSRSLFGPSKSLDIPNLLNLRDVELIPAKKVTVARNNQMRPENSMRRILSPGHNMDTDLDNFHSSSSPLLNIGRELDCNGDGSELNKNYDNPDKNIHTDIINTIPAATRPFYYNENKFERPQNNMHLSNALKNFATEGDNPYNCIDGNGHIKNSDMNSGSLNRKNLNQILTEGTNSFQNFQRSPSNIGNNHLLDSSRDASEDSNFFVNQNAPGLNNLRSVPEDLMLNNINNDNLLRPNEMALPRKAITEICTLDNSMNPENLERALSNDKDSNSLSMDHLQKMSDSMLRSVNENVLNNINTPKNNYERTSIQDAMSTGELFNKNNAPIEIPRTSLNHEKASTNAATCFEHDKSARNTNNEMYTAASEFVNPQYRIRQDPNTLEDIDLDIFQYQPPLSRSNGIRHPELPFINMKSYKTQLPVPKALDFQPVKLQKAIRRGNDILGATLTMKPHLKKNSLPLLKNKLRSSLNPANGLRLPDIDDVRAYLENIYELPLLSNLACNHLSPLSEQVGDYSNNIKTYIPGTLGNTLRERDSDLMDDALLDPSEVFESIAEASEDINDKLKTLRLNLDERIKQFHESITGRSRTSTFLTPQQQNRVTNARYNPISDSINANRGNIFNMPASPGSNVRESRWPGLRSTLNNEAPNRSPPTIGNNPSPLPNARFNRPLTRPDLASKKVESLGRRPSDTRKTPSLLDRLKAKESKGIISLTTTKRPPIVQPLAKPKPALPRPSTIQSKLAQPRTGVERIGIKRKDPTREPKSSPSEVSYTKTPASTRTSSLPESLGRETSLRGLSNPQTTLSKSTKPVLAKNSFLSKVNEAVLSKDAKTVASNSDVLPSASEAVRHTQCLNGMSFNCKMVCEHS